MRSNTASILIVSSCLAVVAAVALMKRSGASDRKDSTDENPRESLAGRSIEGTTEGTATSHGPETPARSIQQTKDVSREGTSDNGSPSNRVKVTFADQLIESDLSSDEDDNSSMRSRDLVESSPVTIKDISQMHHSSFLPVLSVLLFLTIMMWGFMTLVRNDGFEWWGNNKPSESLVGEPVQESSVHNVQWRANPLVFFG